MLHAAEPTITGWNVSTVRLAVLELLNEPDGKFNTTRRCAVSEVMDRLNRISAEYPHRADPLDCNNIDATVPVSDEVARQLINEARAQLGLNN